MSYNLPSRRLVSQDDASFVAAADVPRSKFIGSWTRKTTFDAGYLVPFLVDEVIPGDHLSYDVTAYVRMSTPLFPMFDSQRVDTFFFFVPCRLVWPDWPRFMGEQNSPDDDIEEVSLPTLSLGGATVGSLYDHMGLPVSVQVTNPRPINALPFRAYNLIWNEWFRDQNLQPKLSITASGTGSYTLQRRAKSHDYFTSALPWPQKFTQPTLPIAGVAPVKGIGFFNTNASSTPVNVWETGEASTVQYSQWKMPSSSNHEDDYRMYVKMLSGAPQIYADLAQASGTTINMLRQAFLVQSLLERDARGGTRYTELIFTHFRVRNPDYRLQRPEYIGGGRSPLNITPVAQTAPSEDAVVGALGAAGTSVGGHSASYAATEHGYVIGLINVKSELSYQQGLHRMWTRKTRYDWPWPSLAGLGEQAVLRQEIYSTGVQADDEKVFGYQERYHEWRTRYSDVSGMFRSQATGTLDSWHLSERFLSAPVLGPTFIQDNPPMDRVLAAGQNAVGQQYLADILIKRTAVRPLPMFGTPATLGRF